MTTTESLALMLGAGGAHAERALTQLNDLLQIFLGRYVSQIIGHPSYPSCYTPSRLTQLGLGGRHPLPPPPGKFRRAFSLSSPLTCC